MQRKFRIAYFAHSIRSDWNNGNAHFLRGLIRELIALGHEVVAYELSENWSIQNLVLESKGRRSVNDFHHRFPEIVVRLYSDQTLKDDAHWKHELRDTEIVIVHEWNSPALTQMLLALRNELRFKLLFHDTHHRASSDPEQIHLLGVSRFDGVLAFGESLQHLYIETLGMRNTWILHEAADTSVFHPLCCPEKKHDLVWIGNWGDDERSQEICEFLVRPISELQLVSPVVFGVRYPERGIFALENAGITFGGYLPNLDAPEVFSESRLTVHIPRRHYATAMYGIPTIRVFEALACGIPLISAPWQDIEHLFRPGDFHFVRNGEEMRKTMAHLLNDSAAAEEQALRGLETVLQRHTCRHRAEELTAICEEVSR
ncbi:CgeB family protein [Terriglobus albidus]|uniref:CgeB family protein n=1 Tax=Terriglobus albidus TaxID=1592106 RepID=UPI0021DFC04F|nr:glycosyltransferase [Terriglobus albidus]